MQTVARKRERMLAPKEVASELGLHVSSVYRSVARGDLPSVRLNVRGAIRIPASALETEERS